MPFLCRLLLIALGFFSPLFFTAASVLGQPNHGEEAAPISEAMSNDSPRLVLVRFLELARADNFEMASTYLDHRLPRRMVPQLTKKLYTLMNQAGWITIQRISDNPVGDITDNKDLNLEVVGSIRLKGGEEDILLRRLRADHGEGYTWKFDHDFLTKVPALYTLIEEQSFKHYFPLWSHDIEIFGVHLWQWFMLISALFMTIFLALLITKISYRFLVYLNTLYHHRIDTTVLRDSFRPIKYLFMISFLHFVTRFLEIPLQARALIYSAETLLSVVIVASVGLKASNLFISYLHGVLEKTQRTNAIAMLPSARKALKIMIIVIAITYFLTKIGVNITAIVAGLGIGGIAVALASQKTIENLIGGISIIIDQPVRVGDFCRFGENKNKEGKVEDIGLRSTRIRTLDRTLVSIPNSEFAQTQIENFGKRDMIRLYEIIGLRYDTSAEQLRSLLAKINALLLVHPRIAADPLRVHFINFGLTALEIEIFAYVMTSEQADYLKVKEEINLGILELVGVHGVRFAHPANAVYLEGASLLQNRDSLRTPDHTPPFLTERGC